MNSFNKDIFDYKIVHGRHAFQFLLPDIKEKVVSIHQDIHPYTVLDLKADFMSVFQNTRIENNKINVVYVDEYIKWETKIKSSIDHIKSNYNSIPKYVLYIDAFDVLITNNIDNPEEMLNFYDCKVLFNGEANFSHTGFPDPVPEYFNKLYYEERQNYHTLNNQKYGHPLDKGLNAGVFLGEKEFVLSLLEETYDLMMDNYNKGYPYGCKDDQCLLRYMQNKYYKDVAVDVFNKYFFHCTYLSNSDFLDDAHHYKYFDRFKHLYKNG